MAVTAVDLRKIIQIAVPIAAALIAISAGRISAQAEDASPATASHMLVIPASDGYGFDECLGKDKACGKIIADAWCEAHGMSAALSFGRAEDVTASIPSRTTATKIDPHAFLVACRD